ncbi:MAG: BatD family protein [Verrucomicrobiota bacterium]
MVRDMGGVLDAMGRLFHWMLVRLGPAGILAGLLGMVGAVADPSFTAELEPDQVAVGDFATLKLAFTDLGDVVAPPPPVVPNATVTYRGSSHQFAIINFSRSSTVIHEYAVTPKTQGTVTIPAITVDANGKKYTSEPVVLRVGAGRDLSSIGFLKLSVPRTNVYVGETFPVEVRFYFRISPAQQAPPTIAMEGFLKGRQHLDSLPPESINGHDHAVARWSLAVTAVKPGEFEIGPAELQTLYRYESRRSFFGGYEQRQLNFTSEPLHLRVLSPPAAGRPSTFDGAVGRFRIDVTASPTNVTVGDPVTVRVRVSGTGNFDGLSLPALPPNSGFQSYPGTNSFVEAKGDPLGLSGTKNFEVVLVPEQSGLQRLRWPVLTSWDPVEKKYVTEEGRPLAIQVRPGAGNQAQPVGSNVVASAAAPSSRTGPVSGDLALKTELGRLQRVSGSLVTDGGYWVAFGMPVLTYALVAGGIRWRRRRREDPAVAQGLRLRHAIVEAMASLPVHAQSGRSAEFFVALHSALQGQLALTLGGTAGSYTEDVIDGKLVSRGLDPEDVARLRSLFSAIAQARFAPGTTPGELSERAADTELVIKALRRLEESK